MGLEMLPDELLLTLKDRWTCREAQLRQLSTLLSVSRILPMSNPHLGCIADNSSLAYQALVSSLPMARMPLARLVSSGPISKRVACDT